MPIRVRIREILIEKYGENEKLWPSVTSMADVVDLDRRTVEAWIDGSISRTEFKTLDKWCEFLGVEIEDILQR